MLVIIMFIDIYTVQCETPTVVRFEVFMMVKIQVKVVWVVTACSAAVGYHCFEGPCCPEMEAARSSKMLVSYHNTEQSQPTRP
jgi:hypothetical protein